MSEFPPPQLKIAVEEVATLLRERKETISVAETTSGGLISAALLSTPGASQIFKGGVNLYSLESRIAYAGWTQANAETYQGPTPEGVTGLATHVHNTLKSTYCIGESGNAGPTALGPAPNRQPSYVVLVVLGDNGPMAKEVNTGLGNDRSANMLAFAVEALKLVKEYISTKSSRTG